MLSYTCVWNYAVPLYVDYVKDDNFIMHNSIMHVTFWFKFSFHVNEKELVATNMHEVR